MLQLTSGALLDAVRGVHWPARRITRGTFHGEHRSRRIGSSPEFMDYRVYRQGDESSKIDWKLFGRTERVAIRVSHDQSSFKTMVLVDASASMGYPAATLEKWELAASIALGLCAVANDDGDPVGIAVVDGTSSRVIPPRTRHGTIANIIHALVETRPSGSPALAPVLAALGSSRRVAVVSDFLGDADALLAQAQEMIASGRELFAVHVVAREELDPAMRGAVIVDPEDEAVRRPFDASAITEYQDAFGRWRESLATTWRAAGAVYHLAVTGDLPDKVVRQVVRPEAAA